MNTSTEILTQGEQIVNSVKPDNKHIFPLTEDDCAFINSINMQLDMLKTFTLNIIANVEKQMDTHTRLLEHFKDQFLVALANKHGAKVSSGSLSINLENKVLLCLDDKE